MNIESEIYNAVKINSVLFLNRGIKELASHKDFNDSPLNTEITTIAVLLLQTSFELALNAYSINKYGLSSILNNKQASLSDNEIRDLYTVNELPTKNISTLIKDLMLSDNMFTKEDDQYHIEYFKNIRNKFAHLNCNLHKDDRYDIKYELIYFVSRILVPLIADSDYQWTTSIVLQDYLDKGVYKSLITYQPYIEEMEKLASADSENVYHCFFCNKKTFATETEFCYTCNFDFSTYEFLNCDLCGSKGSVIYDHLNIEINDNEAKGLCLNCNEDDFYYVCPECGYSYGIEANCGINTCSHGSCINSA